MAAKSILVFTVLFLALFSCVAANGLKPVNLTMLFNNSGQPAVENNYNLYSEIIGTAGGSNFHFMFVENNNTSVTDPSLLVVLNAGAYIGTSTLLNLFQGFGPVFQMNNQWVANVNGSWHQINSSILYIESFYGSGFSWTNNTNMTKNVTTTQLGAEVLTAFQSWNATYGKTLNFTLYGEGFGAQLAIEMASMIVNNANYNTTVKPYFKGILIGNGAFTTEDIPNWTNKHQFFYKNNLISEVQFDGLNQCLTNPNSVQCAFAQEQATNNLFPGLNQYYIYDSCNYNGYPAVTDITQWNDENMLCINNQSTTALLQNYTDNPIDTVLNVNVSQVAGGNWTAFNPSVQNSATPLMNMTQNTLNRTLNMLWGLRNASVVIQFFSGDANIMFSYVDAKANIPQIPNINQINYQYFGSNVPYNPNDYVQPCLQVGGFVTYYDQQTSYYWVKHAGFFTAHDQYMAMYQVYSDFVASVTTSATTTSSQNKAATVNAKLDL